MGKKASFIERRFNALAREIMDIVEIILSGQDANDREFKLVRKKVLDAVNDTRRDIEKNIKEGLGEYKGEGIQISGEDI